MITAFGELNKLLARRISETDEKCSPEMQTNRHLGDITEIDNISLYILFFSFIQHRLLGHLFYPVAAHHQLQANSRLEYAMQRAALTYRMQIGREKGDRLPGTVSAL